MAVVSALNVLRAIALLTTASLSTGCGLIFQTVVGWHTQDKQTVTEQKQVDVVSIPPGADVVRRAPDGREQALGTAPMRDSISYQVEVTTESPSVWALL